MFEENTIYILRPGVVNDSVDRKSLYPNNLIGDASTLLALQLHEADEADESSYAKIQSLVSATIGSINSCLHKLGQSLVLPDIMVVR
jgi:hypothetical protein